MTGTDGGLVAGEAEAVAGGVERVLAPNPGIMTGPGTNTYIVGDDREIVVVDPGPDDDAHFDALTAAVAGRRVVAVLATHHHHDHWPLSRRLCAEYGAPLVAHGFEGVLVPDDRVVDGNEIVVGGSTLRAVHTPGHASDHLCWHLAEQAILFTGDHVMGGSALSGDHPQTVVIAPPDGDMALYLESLQRTAALAPSLLMPAHGDVIGDPAAVFSYYLSHRHERERQVVAALEDGPGTVADIVARVYTDVAEVLHLVARYSVLAHLEKLRAEGRVAISETPDGDESPPDGRGGDNPELPATEPSAMSATWRLPHR